MTPSNEAEYDEWTATCEPGVRVHELIWCVEQCNAAHEPDQNPQQCDDGFH